MRIPGATAAVDTEWGKKKNSSSEGCKESDVKVRSHPSGEEVWKNNPLREFDRQLSLEERRTCQVLPEMQGVSCVDHEGYRAVSAEQHASGSRMTAAKFLGTFSKLPGMVGETR